MSQISLHNSLTRQKESFEPRTPGFVGMYVCGPTVYNDVHLGNCRTFVNFDVIYRFLVHKGFKVRYVRNITDVGHLLDDGEDRIAKGARLDKLEPMEVVQKYTNGFHDMMAVFNTIPPSIEPSATGHIIEQIKMVQDILDNGLGYEVNGSVYFDVQKFNETHKDVYGQLSGRKLDDLLSETRDLKNQGDKKNPSDFAIWMKASPEHIMRWPSPWSDGFPGWHLECSAMSTKYLGKEFDIHGGGGDLKFPHHENEIAQNVGACGCSPAKYWLHANMLLMNGKKMSKSDGNTISPTQLFTGNSPHITKSYKPMVVKFFMLQSHYRSTLDLTDDALQAAEKGFHRMMEAYKTLGGLVASNSGTASKLDEEITTLIEGMDADMCDDFNAPKAIGRMFEIVSKINGIKDGHINADQLSPSTLAAMQSSFKAYLFDILGLKDEGASGGESQVVLDGLMNLILEMRTDARAKKDWDTSDKIRDTLNELKIKVKDGKEGSSWSLN